MVYHFKKNFSCNFTKNRTKLQILCKELSLFLQYLIHHQIFHLFFILKDQTAVLTVVKPDLFLKICSFLKIHLRGI